jgi:hypothetical protein
MKQSVLLSIALALLLACVAEGRAWASPDEQEAPKKDGMLLVPPLQACRFDPMETAAATHTRVCHFSTSVQALAKVSQMCASAA